MGASLSPMSNIFLTHSVPLSPPFCSSLGPGPLCIRFSAFHQRTSTFLLWPSSVLPPVLSKVSSDLRGALPQTAQAMPSCTPPLFHLSSAWAPFPLMEGRQLGDHQCGALLRHLHSDSETHFYLFTVNSYRCSQQFLALLPVDASCWLLH